MNRWLITIGIVFSTSFLSAQMMTVLATVSFDEKGSLKKEVITNRTVHVDAVIESILYGQPPLARVLKSKMENSEQKKQMERYLIQKIVYLESKSFNSSKVESQVLNGEILKVRRAVQKEGDLKELWGFLTVSESELKRVVEEKLESKKFLNFKEQASHIPATEAEALSYYQNNKKEFQGHSFESLKAKIREEIAREQTEQRIADWLDILKKKYDLILVTPL